MPEPVPSDAVGFSSKKTTLAKKTTHWSLHATYGFTFATTTEQQQKPRRRGPRAHPGPPVLSHAALYEALPLELINEKGKTAL